MPLTWSATAVHNYEELATEDEALITEALVFLTMAIGIPKITEANAAEFHARVSMWEGTVGAQITAPKYRDAQIKRVFPGDLVRQHVASHLGLLRVVDKGYRENDVVVLTCRPYDGTEDTETLDIIDDRDATIELHDGFGPQPITPHDVVRRIGFGTNAPTKSKTTFLAHLHERALESSKERTTYARLKLEAANA